MNIPHRFLVVTLALLTGGLLSPGCKRLVDELNSRENNSADKPTGPYTGRDRVRAEVDAFRYRVRGYYNNRNFSALEKTMEEIRSGPPLFGDGSWKLAKYYDCLQCGSSETEGMWQLHEQIHKQWIAAYPQSITAQVAQADFFVSYAWHARGSGFSNTVSEASWGLFGQRLAAAQQVLSASKSMRPQCPMWWEVQEVVARGAGWKQAEFAKVYLEAKQVAPQFYYIDQQLATYLLPRWFGREGDWEKAAEQEMRRPEGLKAEGYARTVSELRSYYKNIFRESSASWPNARAGFEILMQKYPDSLADLTTYCNCACLAEDRAVAQKLFQKLNGYEDDDSWGGASEYRKYRDWALR